MEKQIIAKRDAGEGHDATRTALIFAGLFALVALSYAFLDRQVASGLRPYTHGVQLFIWMTYIVNPLIPLASIAAAFIGARALVRGSLTPAESLILRICCALLVAYVLKEQLKYLFGRTWPETWVNNNPSFFGDGTYGFFPLHGGAGYASFPSGHTTLIAAVAGALWSLVPRLRWLGVALVLAVAAGLLGADYHWLSDIMAGAILGGTTGLVAAGIGRSSDAA
ncbi:MAG: phosphatase PAP2 family protein [Rhodomicrobium sp.]|jgi:membrane-associated phospholipid phosphatase